MKNAIEFRCGFLGLLALLMSACFANKAAVGVSTEALRAVYENNLCKVSGPTNVGLVAIPIDRTCEGLTLQRDFFDPSIYGADEEFVPALRKVATALRSAASGKTKLLAHHIDKSVLSELFILQMASLTYMGLSPESDFEYEFRFRLSDSIVVALLAESGRVEFARVIE